MHKVYFDGLITLALFGIGKGFNYKSYKRSWLIKKMFEWRCSFSQDVPTSNDLDMHGQPTLHQVPSRCATN